MRIPLVIATAGTVAALTVGVPVSVGAVTRTAVTRTAVSRTAVASQAVAVTGQTTVAAFKSGAIGAIITAYKGPSLTSGIQGTVQNHKNVFGRAVFTVIGEDGDFYKVNLPVRPNGSVGYISKSDVTTFANPYRITISLSAKRLTAYKGSQVIFTTTAAIGKKSSPSPTGAFYTVDLVSPRKKTGAYGPYAIGLSGFSNVFQRFGTGDGRIAIHGTNETKKLGTAVSSGCVRLSNAAITTLATTLPLGTPVIISA